MLSLGRLESEAIVLVTGASGFIGRHCVELFERQNFRVHAVTRHAGHFQSAAGVQWHVSDLLEQGTVRSLLAQIRPTHLLHLAWYAEPGKFWTSLENYRHVAASLELLQAFAAAGGRRAVVAGTGAEYDWRYGYCSEDVTPLVPRTTYGTCKNALRLLATALAADAGFSLAWGRVFWLFGPYEHPSRLVASVINSILTGGVAACSAGTQLRPFLHVSDVATALIALLDGSIVGPVNIAAADAVRVRDVVQTIARQMNATERIRFGVVPTPADDPPVLMANTRRLTDEVGWTPAYDLDSGLADTIAWWRSHNAAR
jgi:nucleoside-diphosphate-sugar epimerase